MATDKKITELPNATLPIAAGVKFEAVQGGVNVQVDADDMPGSGGGVTDGDKGDVVVSSSGTVWTVEAASETQAGKIEIATQAETNTGTDDVRALTPLKLKTKLDAVSESWEVPFTDEITPITATTNKLTFYWPYATTTITGIWAGLTTPQTSGSIFTIDVNKNGVTILSTKLTIDNTEDTSLTAATQPVISVSSITRGDKVTIDVDQQGDNTAKGAKVIFDFTRPK